MNFYKTSNGLGGRSPRRQNIQQEPTESKRGGGKAFTFRQFDF